MDLSPTELQFHFATLNVRSWRGIHEAQMGKKRTIRSIQTDAVLEEAGRHVHYEIAMLIHSVDYYAWVCSLPPSAATDKCKNMAIESFLLHYRNLRGFLCPSIQTSWPDDVIASDFLKGTWGTPASSS